MKRTRTATLLAALLAAVMLFAACSGGTSSNSSQGSSSSSSSGSGSGSASASTPGSESTGTPRSNELTMYTAWPEAEIPIYFNAFEEDTGIKVNYVRLSAGEMLARVTAEKDNPNASLMVAGSSDTYIMAASDGLFYPYLSPERENFPEYCLDEEGYWSPLSTVTIAFACNTDWFEANNLEYPKSWADLLKPEFAGQVSISHPSTAGTGYTIMVSLVELWGEDAAWDYFNQLKQNVRQFTKSGTAPAMEVALGEAAIGVMYDQAGLSAKNQGYPIELVYPEDGSGSEITSMAIINNGPEDELENAKIFIDWIMSVRGQEMFIEAKASLVPLNINARVADGLFTPAELNIIPHDAVWSSENRTRLIEAFIEKVDNGESLG